MSNLILSKNTPFEPETNHWKGKLQWVKPLKPFTDASRLISLLAIHTFIFPTNKKNSLPAGTPGEISFSEGVWI